MQSFPQQRVQSNALQQADLFHHQQTNSFNQTLTNSYYCQFTKPSPISDENLLKVVNKYGVSLVRSRFHAGKYRID